MQLGFGTSSRGLTEMNTWKSSGRILRRVCDASVTCYLNFNDVPTTIITPNDYTLFWQYSSKVEASHTILRETYRARTNAMTVEGF